MAISLQTHKRILVSLGQISLFPRVLRVLEQPATDHFDKAFIRIKKEVQRLLHWMFQTKNELTIPIAGPGSAGMQMCFANLIEPGDKVIVCENGFFCQRIIDMVQRCECKSSCFGT